MGRRKSQAEWSRIVEGLEASGMSAKEYARQHRLNLENLRWWRSMLRRRARDNDDRSAPPMTIVELRPIPAVAYPLHEARLPLR